MIITYKGQTIEITDEKDIQATIARLERPRPDVAQEQQADPKRRKPVNQAAAA